jgi:Tfp pilus assembly protein PilN
VIEINLLPGSKKAPRRGLPQLGGALKLPALNRHALLLAAAWVVASGFTGWLHLSTSTRINDLETAASAAVRDSARYAQLRAQGDSLTAREGVIAQKMQVIQDIDAARFVWPHILDEISRALPPYIWLISLTDAFTDAGLPRLRVQGNAGNTFALTKFMDDLEASPFLQGVRLISSEQTRFESRTVHNFLLELAYREPPPDVIQTVPLFGASPLEH